MRRRAIRFWWEQDVHTGWRRLYTSFNRAGRSKKEKQRTNRYDRHVEKKRDIREQQEK